MGACCEEGSCTIQYTGQLIMSTFPLMGQTVSYINLPVFSICSSPEHRYVLFYPPERRHPVGLEGLGDRLLMQPPRDDGSLGSSNPCEAGYASALSAVTMSEALRLLVACISCLDSDFHMRFIFALVLSCKSSHLVSPLRCFQVIMNKSCAC